MTRRAPPRPCARTALVVLAACGPAASWSCDGSGDESGRPPPAGYPQLASRYDVVVEVLASDCAPGRQPPLSTITTTASVVQDRVAIEWTQDATEDTGRSWLLSGNLERRDDGGFQLGLRGGREAGVDDGACEARLIVPAPVVDAGAAEEKPAEVPGVGGAEAKPAAPSLTGGDGKATGLPTVVDAGLPDPEPDALILALDACGSLRGEAWVGLTTEGKACPESTCRMRLRWFATERSAAACDAGP